LFKRPLYYQMFRLIIFILINKQHFLHSEQNISEVPNDISHTRRSW